LKKRRKEKEKAKEKKLTEGEEGVDEKNGKGGGEVCNSTTF
jgi:hypothetical protein